MAALPDADRVAIWREFMEDLSNRREGTPFSKGDLRAGVDALDGWLDANAASANTALPQPFRGAASVQQKALLLQFVIQKRYLRS
ncbi:hypothetical protein LCGC14_0764910 [marine sediment metagenome]|uniref:Uncharacterized protein n=1 Tax=marine sediment metagenome TaxID=412755 RepID=A0A0F9QJW4_9ZZZZ